ncbi:MAG: MCP four helix bundle domain-containing protein, partial [Proteobacteria bacterium]|nr:MCP four helix bundle domain-containing protein [Pseudomonadota bacterium]
MNLLNKMLIAPAVTVALMLVLGAVSYWSTNSQHSALEELFNGRFSHTAAATKISADVLRTHSQVYRVMTWSASRGDAYLEKETKVLLEEFDRNAVEFNTWASRPGLSEQEAVLAKQMMEQIAKYKKSIASALDMATADLNSAIMTMQSADENFKYLSDSAEKLVALEKQLGKADVDRSASLFQQVLTVVLLLLLVSIGIAAGLSLYMARGIKRQIGGEPADATEIARRIAAGDLSSEFTLATSDTDSLLAGMKTMQGSVQALVKDAGMLADAAKAGKLSTRADASKHQGDFNRVVSGVNQTLDAVIGPLNVAASYVDQISKGAIPAKITDSYNGDFNTLKNNLNVCIDSVNSLVADAGMLSQAAVAGKLETRADAAKHQGDFRKIVEGVNQTLDAVIGPLNVAASYVDQISKGAIPAKITDSYNGDFNTLKNNLNVAIDSINALVADAAALSKAAVDGKLETRADAAKHQGDFRKIVEGVNQTL